MDCSAHPSTQIIHTFFAIEIILKHQIFSVIILRKEQGKEYLCIIQYDK